MRRKSKEEREGARQKIRKRERTTERERLHAMAVDYWQLAKSHQKGLGEHR